MSDVDVIAEIERSRLVIIVRLAQPGRRCPGASPMAGPASSSSASRRAARSRRSRAGANTSRGSSSARAPCSRPRTPAARSRQGPVPALARVASGRRSTRAAGGVPYIPGALTPSECHAPRGCAADQALPGITARERLRARSARPVPLARLIPTGGVSRTTPSTSSMPAPPPSGSAAPWSPTPPRPRPSQRRSRALTNLISSQQGAD